VIQVTQHEEVRVLTICRPERRNALDNETIEQLRAQVREANADEALRAMVITGQGELAFCSGSDMKAAQEMTLEQRIEHARSGQDLMDEIASLNVLSIAAVEGFALGGGLELALSCDLIVSGSGAMFGLPEVTRSAIPSWGGTYRLSKAVGLAIARNMLLGGKRYTADEVLNLGLVLEVAPVGMAGNRAVEIAQNMTSDCPKEVVALAKELLTSGAYRSAAESKEAEFAAEAQVSAGDTYATFPEKTK